MLKLCARVWHTDICTHTCSHTFTDTKIYRKLIWYEYLLSLTFQIFQKCIKKLKFFNRRPRVTAPAQDLHIQHVLLPDRLRPATRTAAATIGLHNQRISAQTVRNRLREAHLHARCPHRGLDLTPVRRRNGLERANAHIRWRPARWRGVLFTDESRFSLFRADGRQRVWRRVGERFF